MCFNEGASLFALGVGMTFSTILFAKGMVLHAVALFSITIMQLYEYFAHVSINTDDPVLNRTASQLIFFGIAIQPLLAAYLPTCHMPSKTAFKFASLEILRGWPLMIVYVLVAAWMYTKVNMKTTFVGECGTVCRLNWFTGTPAAPFIVFWGVYLMVLGAFAIKGKSKSFLLSNFTPIILAISFFYTFILHDTWQQKVGYLGSLWCFLAVFAGPIYLFTAE